MSREDEPIDVDESIASAIVAFVPDMKDRLALGCLSRAWRLAASSPSCWSFHDSGLVVPPSLAKILNDHRFDKLMSCAGHQITHIEVHDASPSFRLGTLCTQLALPLPKLRSIDFRGCGISVRFAVLPFVIRLEHRLDIIKVDGCDLDGMSLRSVKVLWNYVCDDYTGKRGAVDIGECPLCRKIKGKGSECRMCDNELCEECVDTQGYDKCDICKRISCQLDNCVVDDMMDAIDAMEILYCAECKKGFCNACCDALYFCRGSASVKGCRKLICDSCSLPAICDICRGHWCEKCDEAAFVRYCDTCNKSVCEQCADRTDVYFDQCDECFKSVCEQCAAKTDVRVYFDRCDECYGSWCEQCADKAGVDFDRCDECHGSWCSKCSSGNHYYCIEGTTKKEGCGSTHCEACVEKKGIEYFYCDKCHGEWCSKCNEPGVVCDECYIPACLDCEDYVHCPRCCESWCRSCAPDGRRKCECGRKGKAKGFKTRKGIVKTRCG